MRFVVFTPRTDHDKSLCSFMNEGVARMNGIACMLNQAGIDLQFPHSERIKTDSFVILTLVLLVAILLTTH